ncbi:hypothetical protein PHYSODRAFT_409444, partial [Phytophthora sojae]
VESVESMCGWCGAPECDWLRYGGELEEAGKRLQGKLARKRHRNRAIRISLRRLYLYAKNGNMKGDAPACITRRLNQLWPD